MADTRLPDRWLLDKRMRTLSDAQWRLFTTALMYCNQQETDGAFDDDDLRMLPVDAPEAGIAALVDRNLVDRVGNHYQFVEWDGDLGQTTSAELDARREKNREKQRRFRERNKPRVTGDVTGDVTGYVTRGVGEDRQGEARQGQDQGEAWHQGEVDQATGELLDPPPVSWPTAVPPEDPGYCEHGMTLGKRCRHCPGAVAEARAA